MDFQPEMDLIGVPRALFKVLSISFLGVVYAFLSMWCFLAVEDGSGYRHLPFSRTLALGVLVCFQLDPVIWLSLFIVHTVNLIHQIFEKFSFGAVLLYIAYNKICGPPWHHSRYDSSFRSVICASESQLVGLIDVKIIVEGIILVLLALHVPAGCTTCDSLLDSIPITALRVVVQKIVSAPSVYYILLGSAKVLVLARALYFPLSGPIPGFFPDQPNMGVPVAGTPEFDRDLEENTRIHMRVMDEFQPGSDAWLADRTIRAHWGRLVAATKEIVSSYAKGFMVGIHRD